MIGPLIDIQRVRQYFDAITWAQAMGRSVRADAHVVDQVRRGLLPLPWDHPPGPVDPFPRRRRRRLPTLAGRRVAVLTTGGSGALASILGVVRGLDEAGVRPVGYGLCSGSALFGVPLAAGLSTDEVARFVLSLRPVDYLDPDWGALLTMPLRLGRGWSGLLRGDALEDSYRALLGDCTLGELPVPCWLPVWNIERNRLAYLGPDTHPDLPAARAVRMAVALPLAVQATPMDGGWWTDGGVVDILPAEPFVGTDRCDLAVVVNGFYPSGFAAQTELGWQRRRWSILHISQQTRTMQHLQLARRSYQALCAAMDVELLEPVPFETVQGAGLYGQFLDSRRWPEFIRAGYDAVSGIGQTSRLARLVGCGQDHGGAGLDVRGGPDLGQQPSPAPPGSRPGPSGCRTPSLRPSGRPRSQRRPASRSGASSGAEGRAGDGHERGQRQADGIRVDQGREAADDAALLQPADPLVHGSVDNPVARPGPCSTSVHRAASSRTISPVNVLHATEPTAGVGERTWPRGQGLRAQRDVASAVGERRPMTMRWIWLVPSTICSTLASRM